MKRMIIMLGILGILCGCHASPISAQEEMVTLFPQGAQPISLQVEVAENDVERARGLMDRKSLPENHGMLFVFPNEQEVGFWMKNTLIPLDMIFIKADGTILSIHHMAKPRSLSVIKSGGPVRAGLEINGGMAQKIGLKEGDEVHHTIFGNQLDPK